MKVQFYLQTDKNPAPIYVRFNDGRRFDLRGRTGLVVNPAIWDADKWKPGKPKTALRDAESKRQANRISAELKRIDRDLSEHYNTGDRARINKDWLNHYFRPELKQDTAPGDLLSYFDFYADKKRHELKKPSLVKLGVVRNLVERMQREYGKTISIAEIDQDFLKQFQRFSSTHGYAPNTTARNFRFIKTICYDAVTNGVQVSPQLKRLNLKNSKADKIYLTPEDIEMIDKAQFNQDHLSTAKDWLLISCECGQRVSDFMRFNKDMIRIEAGKPLIEFTQKKTGKIMTVPLSKKVMKILATRKGQFPPKMSDQRYNEHIKTVCEHAGLTYEVKGSIQNPKTQRKESGTFPKWQLVSSHIGRRSFATNNYGRIPTALLIAATGHSSESQFLVYIGKTDTQKALQLAEYF